MPEFEPTVSKGLWCPLKVLIQKYTKSLFENLIHIDNQLLDEIKQHGILLDGGGGGDASGRHKICRYFLNCASKNLMCFEIVKFPNLICGPVL